MLIELIYQSGCPNVSRTRQNLLKALAASGVAAHWTEWDSTDPGAPAHVRQLASPTILVNGRDVAADQGLASGEACRLYVGRRGSISGVPGIKLIAAALAPQAPDKPNGPAWRRGLAVAPAAGLAFLPKLACPACWPAYAALLSSLGLTFLLSPAYLLGFSLVFLSLALGAIALAGRRNRKYLPLSLGITASGAILAGKFALESRVLLYAGVVGLMAAGLWSNWPVRGSAAGRCPRCNCNDSDEIDFKEQNDAEQTKN
jgi:mercuric ion transport protein